MNPMMLMMLGVFMPIPLALAFLLPLYVSIFCAVLAIYTEQTDTLMDAFTNVIYIANVYEYAVHYWLKNLATVNHFTYSAPLILLPMVGLLLAILSCYKLSKLSGRYFRNLN